MNTKTRVETRVEFEERSRHAQLAVALAIWLAGAVVAVGVAWRMDHGRWHRAAPHPGQTSTMDWSVDGSGDAVEVDGALVMPEDVIVTHRPNTTGVTIMQKP